MLSLDIEGALPEFQQHAESLMVTPCTITRGGERVLDPNTGDFTTLSTVIYDGGCKVQTREGEVLDVVSGSAALNVQRYSIHVPVSAGPFQDGDLVTVTGRVFKVDGLHSKTWQTAQRLPVVEVI